MVSSSASRPTIASVYEAWRLETAQHKDDRGRTGLRFEPFVEAMSVLPLSIAPSRDA